MPPAELDARRIVCQISKMFRQISIVSDCGALYYIFRIVVEQGFHDPVDKIPAEFLGGTPWQLTGQIVNGHYRDE